MTLGEIFWNIGGAGSDHNFPQCSQPNHLQYCADVTIIGKIIRNIEVRAQITFRHIDNFFLVMFRAGGPATKTDSLHLALDQVHLCLCPWSTQTHFKFPILKKSTSHSWLAHFLRCGCFLGSARF